MSGFVTRLLARASGGGAVVTPRVAPRFAPEPAHAPDVLALEREHEADTRADGRAARAPSQESPRGIE